MKWKTLQSPSILILGGVDLSRIQPAIIGKTPFERLLGHDESVMRQWPELGDTLTGEGKLSAELKEQVRRRSLSVLPRYS